MAPSYNKFVMKDNIKYTSTTTEASKSKLQPQKILCKFK